MASQNDQAAPQAPKTPAQMAATDLFEFAIDREDVKWLLAMVPAEGSIKPATVEYELQLLKTITVGWSIAFYLGGRPQKEDIVTAFWQMVREFADGLSETTGLMIGQEIDYFDTLKQRLDGYVTAMEAQPDATDPAVVAGPHFAGLCGDTQDAVANLAGAKMFDSTHKRVKGYLVGLKLI